MGFRGKRKKTAAEPKRKRRYMTPSDRKEGGRRKVHLKKGMLLSAKRTESDATFKQRIRNKRNIKQKREIILCRRDGVVHRLRRESTLCGCRGALLGQHEKNKWKKKTEKKLLAPSYIKKE